MNQHWIQNVYLEDKYLLTIETKIIMAFNGTEGHVVTLTEGQDWTARYRASIEPGGITGHFFGYEKLNLILNQTGCKGIRIYYGLEADGTKNLVLVGANAAMDDMENGVILEKSVVCPPMCGTKSKLNS